MGALKGNQPTLFAAAKEHFVPEQKHLELSKGHGRIERRLTQICTQLENLPEWPGLACIVRVQSTREEILHNMFVITYEVRYYVASFVETAKQFGDRIRGYWGVENKVHYVRDVTQGEDKCRIRTPPLIQHMAFARNFALNLYRSFGFTNMAQAQRRCGQTLNTLKEVFE